MLIFRPPCVGSGDPFRLADICHPPRTCRDSLTPRKSAIFRFVCLPSLLQLRFIAIFEASLLTCDIM